MGTKVGIIGAGGMVSYHIAGFQAAGAEIIGLADVNEAVAQRVAARHGIPNVFKDPGSMLAGLADLEAVSIIVPNKFHAPLSIEALKAGKHVFCEKPPALNAREMKSIKDAASKAKKTLMFNFNNRARPESQAIMDYVRSGEVGWINSTQAKWIRRTGIPGFGGWFTNKKMAGGGPLIDLLHMLDLGLYFMGYPEPEYVLAQTFSDFIKNKDFKGPWGIPDAAKGVTDVENACHGFVRCKTGQVISLQISWAEMVKREEVSVVFQGLKAGGMVRRLFGVDGIDDTAEDACELYNQEGGRSVNRDITVISSPDMGRIASAANFIRALEGKEKPLNTPAEALSLMKIVDATYKSAQTGKPVKTS